MSDSTMGAALGRPPTAQLSRYAPLLGLVAALAVAAVVTPEFYSPTNLVNVLRQAAILGIVAIGQTFVLLTAGIDLSVGGVMGMSLIIAAQVSGGDDSSLAIAVVLALAVGVVVGCINAFLVITRNVPPFVATLAMFILLEGARDAWTRGIPSGSIPNSLQVIGQRDIAFIPIPALILLIFGGLALFALRRTIYGRRLYAVGSNPRAAYLSGVRVHAYKASAYILCSVLAVVGGLVLSGYIGYVDRYLGQGFELDSIAASVVGGVSLAGGRGGVGGALAGVLFLSVLTNIVIFLNLGESAQLFAKGAVIIAAVALQARRLSSTAPAST
ncbi:MAG: ABC transporter permease [Actinomycetota bacterium]|nr:ABC transporter permease [Actinomycetota bacterium]